MAKKIVRGITDIKTISNQDLDTNNVNDLLSDGEHNYIHRKKKDGSEEYHNLTNNLKTIQSDDTDLVSVTNYNNTTNSATIRPKHDSQKEQLLESTDNTILISHGENGTEETTSVDVNPEKIQKMVAPTTKSYAHTNGYLKIFRNQLGSSDYVDVEEFRFLAKMNKGMTTAEFELDQQDLNSFQYLIRSYGVDGKINVQGSAFQMYENPTKIYFNTNGAQYNPHIINFYDIIPVDPVTSQSVQSAPSRVDEIVDNTVETE